jgi:uncharacterized RDD family membrane protein YckC
MVLMDSDTFAAAPFEGVPVAYASLSARLAAFVADCVVIALGLVFLVLGGAALDRVPGSGRAEVALLWALILLYEPVLVWRRGATVGHRRYGLRVVTARGTPLGFGRAFVRYLVKAILGLLSFVPMFLTRRHQALQDLLTHTYVVVAEPAEAPSHHMVAEREPAWLSDVPPVWRRLIVSALYLAGLFLALAFAYGTLPSECVEHRQCSPGQRVAFELLTLGWLASSIGTAVIGWRGLLPGARRNRRPDSIVAGT